MNKPLAFRIRPKNIDEIIGQEELVGENSILRNSIKQNTPISFILYGNPGCGKTTIAEAYASSLNANIIKLNAVTSNKKDIETAIASASLYNTPTILIIDEIHRINKDKQDILLPFVEEGTIYLIGATTANPYISINKAIRSRVHLLEVKPLKEIDIVNGLKNAIKNKDGYDNKLKIDEESLHYIAKSSGGDFRYSLNYLEILDLSYKNKEINIEDTKKIIKVNYLTDKDEDNHYDSVSALQKSIRGSDVNAALYYAARLCISNDLSSLTRRLLVTAYEDIGIANPSALARTKIAIESAEYIGLPEAIIPISVAIVDLCLSPKSKSACTAIEKAMEKASEPLPVLDYLKYTPVNTLDIDKYPYDNPDIWKYMQYLPEVIKDLKFYIPNKNASSSYEKALNENYYKLEQIVRSSDLRSLKKKYQKNTK